jgi:hypothetical protein
MDFHLPETIYHLPGLGKGKDIGKQHNGTKIQDGDQRSHGCLFSKMGNVKVFHVMNLKVNTKDGYGAFKV